MSRKHAHVSETPATQAMRRAGVPFSEHVYDYVDHGGTTESARQLGVDEPVRCANEQRDHEPLRAG